MQKSSIALGVLAAVLAIVVFFVRPMLLPPQGAPPPASLLPAFLFLWIWDAIAFGVGVALLLYLAMNYSKWPKPIRVPLLVLFLIAAWLTVPNWIHDGMHENGATETNFPYLALVEYLFHVPWLIISGIIVFAALMVARTYTAK